MKLVCFLALCFLAGANAKGYGLEKNGKDWNYEKHGPTGVTTTNNIGPARWYLKYDKCNDNYQSPVNVATAHVSTDKTLGNLTMSSDYNTNFKIKATNMKSTVQFLPVLETGQMMPVVTYGGIRWKLAEITAHWGSTKTDGSEHAIDWQKFAGELQFLHYNMDKYSDLATAQTNTDGLLIWSHFLKHNSVDRVADNQMNTIIGLMWWTKDSGISTTSKNKYNLASLLPTAEPTFYQMYTYKGSLTTPPCYESVRWIINKTPILVNNREMQYFRDLKDSAIGSGAMVSDNFRPIQSRGNRWVYRNFKDDDLEGYCSSAVSVKPVYAVALTIMAGLFLRH